MAARTLPGGPVRGRFGFFFFMKSTSSARRTVGFGGIGRGGPPSAAPGAGGGGGPRDGPAAGFRAGEPGLEFAGGRGGGVEVGGGGGAPDKGDEDLIAEEDMGDDPRLTAFRGRSAGSLVGLRFTPWLGVCCGGLGAAFAEPF